MSNFEQRCANVLDDIQKRGTGCPLAKPFLAEEGSSIFLATDKPDAELETELEKTLFDFVRNSKQKMLALLPPGNINDFQTGEDFAWRIFTLIAFASNKINEVELAYCDIVKPSNSLAENLYQTVRRMNQSRAQLEELFKHEDIKQFPLRGVITTNSFCTQLLTYSMPSSPVLNDSFYEGLVPFVHGTYYPKEHKRHAPTETVFIVNKESDVERARESMPRLHQATEQWTAKGLKHPKALHPPMEAMDELTFAKYIEKSVLAYALKREELHSKGLCKSPPKMGVDDEGNYHGLTL